MRKAFNIDLAEADRQTLIGIMAARNSLKKHVGHVQIVLLMADGGGAMELGRLTGTSTTSVWR